MITLTVLGLVILALVVVRHRRRNDDGPGWRPLTWVILVFNLLMVVWLVAGLGTVAGDDCAAEHPVNLDLRQACEAGTAVGAGIGAAFVIFLWAAGDVVLGVIWLVTRKQAQPGRACPVCGASVPVGQGGVLDLRVRLQDQQAGAALRRLA